MSVGGYIVGIVCLAVVLFYMPKEDETPMDPRRKIMRRKMWKRMREQEKREREREDVF